MNTDKKQHEQDYLDNKVIDCPWCWKDKPNHSCGNCYTEMTQENCWKYEGFCSEKCFKYMKEELPRIREEKMKHGIKCTCDDPNCYKCIGGNCKDEICPTHTALAKLLARKSL